MNDKEAKDEDVKQEVKPKVLPVAVVLTFWNP